MGGVVVVGGEGADMLRSFSFLPLCMIAGDFRDARIISEPGISRFLG